MTKDKLHIPSPEAVVGMQKLICIKTPFPNHMQTIVPGENCSHDDFSVSLTSINVLFSSLFFFSSLQVLSDIQASKRLENPYNRFVFPTFDFPFYDIIYSLDASNVSCEDINYLCASFSAGDSAETKIPSYLSGRHKIPFEVYGEDGWLSDMVDSYDLLVGCVPFSPCLGL